MDKNKFGNGIPGDLDGDLSKALQSNGYFGNDVLVLEKTENSDLLGISKQCSQEFFGRIFSPDGPMWQTFAKTKLGYQMPISSDSKTNSKTNPDLQYVNFLGGRMYFLKNFEKLFLRQAGKQKKFFLRGGKSADEANLEISEYSPSNLSNALLLAFSPIEILTQAIDYSLLPLYANEKMAEFLKFREDSLVYYDKHVHLNESPIEFAKECLNRAVLSMEYSFISSIAAQFNCGLVESPAWSECEQETLHGLLREGRDEEATHHFGFHSDSPYDISALRFWENPQMAKQLMQIPPKDKYARWRENSKMVCSRYLSLMRDAYLFLGEELSLGNRIFHLRTNELDLAKKEPEKWKEIIDKRKEEYESFPNLAIPPKIAYSGNEWFGITENGGEIAGLSVGEKMDASGNAVWISEQKDYRKDVSGKIIVTDSFSPNLASLLGSAIGVVSSGGGMLTHAAIIAREQKIPCIVSAKNIRRIKEGQAIKIDHKSGKILLI